MIIAFTVVFSILVYLMLGFFSVILIGRRKPKWVKAHDEIDGFMVLMVILIWPFCLVSLGASRVFVKLLDIIERAI